MVVARTTTPPTGTAQTRITTLDVVGWVRLPQGNAMARCGGTPQQAICKQASPTRGAESTGEFKTQQTDDEDDNMGTVLGCMMVPF